MGDLLGVLQGAIAFILILGSIVFIHELGHFITAKRFGVYCGEFSLGMGPVLLKKKIGETQYSLRLLPVGGFVSMAGEADDTMKDEEIPFERTIPGKKTYQKIMIMLAGIFMNFVLALVIFIGISMHSGVRVVEGPPVVAKVIENSVAQEMGLQENDSIQSIILEDGTIHNVSSVAKFTELINTYPEKITLNVIRDGKKMELIPGTPQLNDKDVYTIGFNMIAKTEKIGILDSFYYGAKDMVDSTVAMFGSIGGLLQGKNLDQMSGPVGIYKISAQSVEYGLPFFFRLMALLSINLGIVNALPLPILDGGRALIALLERIIGRKMNEKFMSALMWGGAFLLIGLMVFVTFNDVIKLF